MILCMFVGGTLFLPDEIKSEDKVDLYSEVMSRNYNFFAGKQCVLPYDVTAGYETRTSVPTSNPDGSTDWNADVNHYSKDFSKGTKIKIDGAVVGDSTNGFYFYFKVDNDNTLYLVKSIPIKDFLKMMNVNL